MVCDEEVTINRWLTEVAAAKFESPAWEAWMVQVPVATSVTVAPETVQTDVVVELKETGRPEEAVAVTVNGSEATLMLERAAKVIVWVPGEMRNVWSTGAAGLLLRSPGCVASMVQLPVLIVVTLEPATVQTADVSDANVTARPDDAVAVTVNGVA
jgi:hypothetical protein